MATQAHGRAILFNVSMRPSHKPMQLEKMCAAAIPSPYHIVPVLNCLF